MTELSLNILDIAENSVKARATLIGIALIETPETLTIEISDNGCGMKEDFLLRVTDPFTTTRTTRKVGLGIPFFKLEAEQTGGSFGITSRDEESYPDSHGTVTTALFYKNHLDMLPLGDIPATMVTLIQGNPDIDFVLTHSYPDCEDIELDTRQLREILGEDVPLNTPDILVWIQENLREQYAERN